MNNEGMELSFQAVGFLSTEKVESGTRVELCSYLAKLALGAYCKASWSNVRLGMDDKERYQEIQNVYKQIMQNKVLAHVRLDRVPETCIYDSSIYRDVGDLVERLSVDNRQFYLWKSKEERDAHFQTGDKRKVKTILSDFVLPRDQIQEAEEIINNYEGQLMTKLLQELAPISKERRMENRTKGIVKTMELF